MIIQQSQTIKTLLEQNPPNLELYEWWGFDADLVEIVTFKNYWLERREKRKAFEFWNQFSLRIEMKGLQNELYIRK